MSLTYLFYTYIEQAQHEELLRTYLPHFSKAFQKKIQRFRRWEDAQLSLLGRVLLFKGIEKFGKSYTEAALKFTAHNKPYFDQSSLKFNISHSGELVICLLSDVGEMGIDVEWIVDTEINDFKSQMTDSEWLRVTTAAQPLQEFYTYWTEKEAVIKAQGEGLSIPLKTFEISGQQTSIGGEPFFLRQLFLDEQYKCFLSAPFPVDDLPMEIIALNPIAGRLTLSHG